MKRCAAEGALPDPSVYILSVVLLLLLICFSSLLLLSCYDFFLNNLLIIFVSFIPLTEGRAIAYALRAKTVG